MGYPADLAGRVCGAVRELTLDLGGLVDDVVVGEQLAVGRDHHARACHHLLLVLAALKRLAHDAYVDERGSDLMARLEDDAAKAVAVGWRRGASGCQQADDRGGDASGVTVSFILNILSWSCRSAMT